MKGPFGKFKLFIHKYNKNYKINSEEGRMRFDIFKKNLLSIKQHNKKNRIFKLSINNFSDYSPQEYKRILSFNPAKDIISKTKKKRKKGKKRKRKRERIKKRKRKRIRKWKIHLLKNILIF